MDYNKAFCSNRPLSLLQVEMLSHFGREHYCPISLLRVMGASMIEVYEESQLGGGPAQHATPTQTPSLVYAPGVELLDGLEGE